MTQNMRALEGDDDPSSAMQNGTSSYKVRITFYLGTQPKGVSLREILNAANDILVDTVRASRSMTTGQ